MTPRREALCVSLGATTVTVDYNPIVFEHPNMTTVTVPQLNGTFDVILADSSLDHDGLGRYGDPIAPDADLITMDKLRTLGRTLLLTVPVGPDLLAFNLMRIYGSLRLPLLLQGWSILDTFGFDPIRLTTPTTNYRRSYEPVFVLQPSTDLLHNPLLHFFPVPEEEEEDVPPLALDL